MGPDPTCHRPTHQRVGAAPTAARRRTRDNRRAPIARLLAPAPTDYCVLKPKHSGFFGTVLGTLLDHLGARRVVLTGVTTDQCVLFTANDAYVRDLELAIPRDCVAAGAESASRLALRYFRTVLGADLRPSTRLRFARTKAAARSPHRQRERRR